MQLDQELAYPGEPVMRAGSPIVVYTGATMLGGSCNRA